MTRQPRTLIDIPGTIDLPGDAEGKALALADRIPYDIVLDLYAPVTC